MRWLHTLIPVLLLASASASDDRLWIDVKINGQAVRLALDTGAESAFVWRREAKKLGLTFKDPRPNRRAEPGHVVISIADECDLSIFGQTHKAHFLVLELPSYARMPGAGVLGWGNISYNVLSFIGHERKFSLLRDVDASINKKDWLECKLKDAKVLSLWIPYKRDTKAKNGAIYIDTGSAFGVQLSHERWKQWLAANPDTPMTITAYSSPAAGLVVEKIGWADKLDLGQIEIEDVPVMRCSAGSEHWDDHEATFGMQALRRLDLITHGRRSLVYIRQTKRTKLQFQHNRIGAVFVPPGAKGEHLLAHVVKAGPAYQAGIRDKDVLVGIGDLDVTRWRTDPKVLPLSRFWQGQAGSKLELSLVRGGKALETIVELKDILVPHDKHR